MPADRVLNETPQNRLFEGEEGADTERAGRENTATNLFRQRDARVPCPYARVACTGAFGGGRSGA